MMIKDTIKALEKKSIMFSIMLLVLGGLLIWNPIGFIKTIVIIIGAVLFILSIIDFIAYFRSNQDINNANLFKGIIELISAMLLIFRNDVLIDLFPMILGIIIIFNSIFKLQVALNVKKVNDKDWIWGFVISVISIIVGVVIIMNPFETLETIIRITGIVLVATEIISLLYGFIIIRDIKQIVDAVDVVVKDHVEEANIVEVKEGNNKNKKN